MNVAYLFKKGAISILLLVGLLAILLFLTIIYLAPSVGNNFGLLSEKKSGQQAEAKGARFKCGEHKYKYLSCGTLTITPNPVPVNGTYHASGCGYTVGVGLLFNMLQPTGVIAATGGIVGADGCLVDALGNSGFDWNVHGPGSYTLIAYYTLGNYPWTLVTAASTTFLVQ